METKQYLSVRNMAKYQHYKKDKPNWIKLYKSLWNEYEFSVLPDATKAHVIGLFILCSQHNNLAVFDERWVMEELKARGPVDWQAILNSGFIVLVEEDSIKNIDKSYLQKRREEERRGE
jgi:hypothetical protein